MVHFTAELGLILMLLQFEQNRFKWLCHEIRHSFRHFLLFAIFLTIVIIISLIAESKHTTFLTFDAHDFGYRYKPTAKPFNESFQYNVLLNGHCHTNVEKDDGVLSPEYVILWHLANGFNAAIITGHNSLEPAKRVRDIARAKYDDKFKVLVGMEYTNCRIHMNLIGLDVEPPLYKMPSDEELQSVIEFTHRHGGLVVLNHIPWSIPRLVNFPSVAQLAAWGVDYIEVASSEYLDLQTLLFVTEHRLGIITGVDMHVPEGVYSYTVLNAETFSEEAIWAELKAKRTNFIYDAYARPGKERNRWSWKSYIVAPLVLFGQLIRKNYWIEERGMWSFVDGYCDPSPKFGLRWGLLTSTLLWVLLFFMAAEALRIFVPKLLWPQLHHYRHKYRRILIPSDALDEHIHSL